MPDETRLVETAMRLRGVDADGWEAFVMALREYAASATQDLLRVPANDLLKQQGIALGLAQLALQMVKAPETYQRHLERVRHGRPTSRADARAKIWAEAPEADTGSG